MSLKHPNTFHDIGPWAKANGVLVEEAKLRFAQYGILCAVSDSQSLSGVLVLKGGNALDFVWLPNRSTKDLDFSSTIHLESDSLKSLLQTSLDAVSRRSGTLYRVQKVERQPRNPEMTFVTYAVNVGYALTGDTNPRARIEAGQGSPLVVPLDISLNEVICEHEAADAEGIRRLRVSTREDIVAEKLRSLLQQPIRNRNRRQDLLDIAVMHRAHPLNMEKVSSFLLRKSEARGVHVARAAFRDPAIASRAQHDYDALRHTTRSTFIPFNDAWNELLSLVDALTIPPH